ncbi:unnamed protein product, partial [Strongylus vulgaris]
MKDGPSFADFVSSSEHVVFILFLFFDFLSHYIQQNRLGSIEEAVSKYKGKLKLEKGDRRLRLPSWLKKEQVLPSENEGVARMKKQLKGLKLATVCQEARCPNLGECWGGSKDSLSTATILLMGDTCTRGCSNRVTSLFRFCSVKTARKPPPLDPKEPENTAEANSSSCARFNQEIRWWWFHSFSIKSGLDVYAHNLETVERLTPWVRDPRAKYKQSLE